MTHILKYTWKVIASILGATMSLAAWELTTRIINQPNTALFAAGLVAAAWNTALVLFGIRLVWGSEIRFIRRSVITWIKER